MKTLEPGHELTEEEHRQRHVELHKALDELIADFLAHTRGTKLPSTTPIRELMEWSHKQTVKPRDLRSSNNDEHD
jgi:hypothetical protein